MLSVITRSTINPDKSVGVTGFSVALGNGAPLPEWISIMADGEYVIDRTADIQAVTLNFTAHRADGSTLVRTVEIDTLTGEIREKDGTSDDFGTRFSDGLQTQPISLETTAESSDQ